MIYVMTRTGNYKTRLIKAKLIKQLDDYSAIVSYMQKKVKYVAVIDIPTGTKIFSIPNDSKDNIEEAVEIFNGEFMQDEIANAKKTEAYKNMLKGFNDLLASAC